MEEYWDIDEVLDHPKLSDEFKIKFFEELFGSELSDEKYIYYLSLREKVYEFNKL